MARSRKTTDKPATSKRRIEQYDHKGQQRKNNPPVGLVTEATDRDAPKHRYAYDPHLDPALTWAGKAEHTSFEVPTVSLHVHERIDPKTSVEAVRRRNGTPAPVQGSLFETAEENPPLREAIDFYQHAHAWSNRLIAGDSLLVMNSLLEKEGMAGKVQMVYIDPPYGIRYGSNFQPFVNKRDVKDGSDEDLTQEPEMIRAFRDTWELGIHSYLTYLRDRLLLARELLHETGSCFVQISDENVHLVRNLMDEVFGHENFVALVAFKTTGGQTDTLLPSVADHLVWYARDSKQTKYRQLYIRREPGDEGSERYNRVELQDGKRRVPTQEERDNPRILPPGTRLFRLTSLVSQGNRQNTSVPWTYQERTYDPGTNQNWKTTLAGLERLAVAKRIGDEVVPPPPEPKSRIEPVAEKRPFEIAWPNVVRIEHTWTPRLALDWARMPLLRLEASDTVTLAQLAPVVEGKPDVSRISEIDLDDLARRFRMQTIVFQTARDEFDQMAPTWTGSREVLLAQLVALVERFLTSDRVVITPELFNQDARRRRILLTLNMGRIVRHLWEAIRHENTQALAPVFDSERPIRGTGDMLPWHTGRPWADTSASRSSTCSTESCASTAPTSS